MITELVRDSRAFATNLSRVRFKGADRVKINRKEYESYTRSAHLNGKTSICEAIIKMHKENPYGSIDELIGDLQILIVEAGNEFRSVNILNADYNKLCVESVM